MPISNRLWKSRCRTYPSQLRFSLHNIESLMIYAKSIYFKTYQSYHYIIQTFSFLEILIHLQQSQDISSPIDQRYILYDSNTFLKYKIMNIRSLIVYSLLLITVFSEIIPFDQQVMKQIFQENKDYLVYVHGNNYNIENEAVFFSYCIGEKLCAILNPTYEGFQEIIQYIGATDNEYFMIYSSISKRKFILIVKQEVTQNELLTFQYKYLHGEIEPFYASESLPQDSNTRCIKLVGKNIGQFLRKKQKIKIIFLYTINRQCQSCDAILQNYLIYAEQNYSEGKIVFGYFNTFLNDHPVIQDQNTPNILAFIDQEWNSPYQIAAEDLNTLTSFTQQILNSAEQAKKAGQKSVQSEDL